jgi:hypothetical protein
MVNGNVLSELEITKLENFGLKHAAMQQALRENLAARTKYIEQIVAAHPGYRWNEPTGALVPAPTEEPIQPVAEA